jgi:hypothetical protein
MPFLIARLEEEELTRIRSAGFEILAEGSLDAVREFFQNTQPTGTAGDYAVIWLEDGPLETLGLTD